MSRPRGAGPGPRARPRPPAGTHAIALVPREPPLPAVGVVAQGEAVAALKAATRRALERGSELKATAADGWLVVLGDDLPWADGCTYLGRDGPLLVPTTRKIDPPADLVARALGSDPLLVVLDDVVLRGLMPAGTPQL